MLAAVLTALWIWWAIEQGAFFPVVYLPGAALLYFTLVVMLLTAPLPVSLRGPHAVALVLLLGFTAWTAISLVWSPAKDLAFEDAQRTMIYPAAFLAGMWLAVLLRGRAVLVLAPWAAAGAVVAVVTVVQILGADSVRDVLDVDKTLDFPLGYRNANAAFFVAAVMVLVSVVARRETAVPWQGVGAGAAVVCLGLAVLSQSRGSVLAVAAGVLVLVLVSPERPRVALTLAIVAIPNLVLLPQLLDPFAADTRGAALDELQQAARLLPLAAIAGGLLAAGAAFALRGLKRRGDRPATTRRRRLLIAGTCTALVAVAVAVLGIPDPSSSPSQAGPPENRFTYTGGLDRTDFWRVSTKQLSDAPLIGEGSGSFRTRYALDRDAQYLPRDAHSVEFETLGELGGIGALLLLASAVAIIWAALRSRALGAEEATVAAAALAVGAAWSAQASVDWFTSIPALTAPTLALLGAAAGPAGATNRGREPGRWGRRAVAAGLILCALAAAWLFMPERLTFNAAHQWRADPEAALNNLDRAADMNPFADAPLLVTAEIAKQTGEANLGLEALKRARERQPKEWLNYLLEAEILADRDPPAARRALTRAIGLNPLATETTEITRLEARIRRAAGAGR